MNNEMQIKLSEHNRQINRQWININYQGTLSQTKGEHLRDKRKITENYIHS